MSSQDKHPAGTVAPVTDKHSGTAQALHRRAEAAYKNQTAQPPENLAALSPEATQRTLHDLRVHQIELEMQNEELRRIYSELDDERARYFDLYDLAPVGYCTVNEQGLIQQANLTAALLLGMARGALVKRPISRFIVKPDQDIYYLCRQQLINTAEPQACELRMLKHDGTQIWVRLAITAARDSSGAPVLRMALTDVTESKAMATAMQESEARYRTLSEVLQEKNRELSNAKSVAEKASLAKSDFLSSMSHELRTPLSAILGFAQLIESGATPPTPSQKQSLNQILKAGWYLLELINEILDLTQIESGKLSLSMETVSLTPVMQECLAMVEPQAQERGVSVAFSPIEMPYFVQADRVRLKQALINLLSNAIKYNKKDGTVVVDYIVSSPGRMRISVKDTGAGLPPEKLAQLFQPFNRLGQESSTVKGTGIGLVACKRLIELMGGVIGVESTVGKGSVFWIELIRDVAPQLAAGNTLPAERAPQAQGSAPRHTLLYVEDNPANLMLVEKIIEGHPHLRMLSARDGTHGITLARAHLPDVILMDIHLPGISGFQALKILREDPATAHIPVLALSANAMPHDIEKGREAGFFRYLTKPIKLKEFMEALDLALEHAETESDGAVVPGSPR
ncbi:MAG: ATP-binding protein [Sulfuricaulis sp.]|nr:ATP-binding protein [Sulfuricaulis sp.]